MPEDQPFEMSEKPSSPKGRWKWLLFKVGAYMTPLVYAAILEKWGRFLSTAVIMTAGVVVLLIFWAAAIIHFKDIGGWKRVRGNLRDHPIPYVVAIVLFSCTIVGTCVYLAVRPSRGSMTVQNPRFPSLANQRISPTESPAANPSHENPQTSERHKHLGPKNNIVTSAPTVRPGAMQGAPVQQCPPGTRVFINLNDANIDENGRCGIEVNRPDVCLEVKGELRLYHNQGGGLCFNSDGVATQIPQNNQSTVVKSPITQENAGGCNQLVVGGNNNTTNCAPSARSVTDEQKASIAKDIAELPPGIEVVIGSADSGESHDYAEQIRSASGIQRPVGTMFGWHPKGIYFGVHSEADTATMPARKLAFEMHAVGFNVVHVEVDPTHTHDGEILIAVGEQ
jgi:hypothetical protein